MTQKYIHKIYGGWGCDMTCFVCGKHADDYGPDDRYSIGGGRHFEESFINGEKGFLHCTELIPEDRFDSLRKRYEANDFIICGLAEKYPDFKQKLKEKGQ